MPELSSNNKRIAKNTLYLYARMLFSLLVSLYTSRVILHALGPEDYGINNVVGGVVSMFAFLSGTMTTASQRFFSFSIGKGDYKRLKTTFETSNTIIIILAVIIILCVETIGLWLLNNKLVIPQDRMVAAHWVFQFATASLFLRIISVPYNAAIVAHEKMSAFAFIGILDVVLKLVIALIIQYAVKSADKLIIYSSLICGLAILMRLLYVMYSKRNFEECQKVKIKYHKEIGREIFSFFGWNTVGAFSWVAKEQGVNIVINMFCGPIVNAARGINTQVTGAISGFITNFQTAMNPQITKYYAAEDKTAMFNLVFRGAKFSFFLFCFLALPIFIDIDCILDIWLIEIPEHTSSFIRLTLILMSIETLSSPIITSLLATGRVRNYQIIVGLLLLLNLPFSYFALKMGFEPESTIIIAIILSLISFIIRLILLHNYIGFPISRFFVQVFLRSVVVVLLSAIIPWLSFVFIKLPDIPLLAVVCLLSWLCSGLCILYIGTDANERVILINMLKKLIHKK